MCVEFLGSCQGLYFTTQVLVCGLFYAQCEECRLELSKMLFVMDGGAGERLSLQEGES